MKIIGIDIGATKISGVLVFNNHVLKRARALTEAHSNKNKIIKNIDSVIENLFDPEVKAIGIGIPGRVNNKGKIIFIPNIKSLINFNIKEHIEKKFSLRTIIENDAVCFTIAEHEYGSAKGYVNVVGLIIGTGIGSGIIINNKIYKGNDNCAGELGHNLVFADKELKEFESLCSGYNITLKYMQEHGKSRVVFPSEILTGDDKISKHISELVYRYLSVNIANIINTLNPGVIVIGGGVSNSLDYKRLNKEVSKLVISCLKDKINIVKNKVGDDSGVLGAAYLAMTCIS